MAEEKKELQGKPTNCIKCNKRLQKKAWYYRNNGYFCSKRCWSLFEEKRQETLKKEAEDKKKQEEEKKKELKAKKEEEAKKVAEVKQEETKKPEEEKPEAEKPKES
ncbi:MAG: hypothetical protein ABH848_01900 [Candidatus Omnitrophota bacterium]